MFVNPQSQWSQTSGQVRFTPVSSNVTGLGTTVTYSLNPAVNAYAPNSVQSGTFAGIQQSNWSAPVYPNVSAYQYSPLTSGTFTGTINRGMVQPSVDISESNSDVIITAYVPNTNVNDLRLNVTEDSVTISASAWTGTENLVLNRTVALPTTIQAQSCDASLQSGVLEIHCPKADKGVRARTTITPNITTASSGQ